MPIHLIDDIPSGGKSFMESAARDGMGDTFTYVLWRRAVPDGASVMVSAWVLLKTTWLQPESRAAGVSAVVENTAGGTITLGNQSTETGQGWFVDQSSGGDGAIRFTVSGFTNEVLLRATNYMGDTASAVALIRYTEM